MKKLINIFLILNTFALLFIITIFFTGIYIENTIVSLLPIIILWYSLVGLPITSLISIKSILKNTGNKYKLFLNILIMILWVVWIIIVCLGHSNIH